MITISSEPLPQGRGYRLDVRDQERGTAHVRLVRPPESVFDAISAIAAQASETKSGWVHLTAVEKIGRLMAPEETLTLL